MINLHTIAHQKDYEKLVFIVRRHWIILFSYFLMFLLEMILPIAVFLALQDVFIPLFAHSVIGPALLLLLSVYSLFIILLFFFHFIDYYLDVWIITNERLINIEQRGLFARSIAELRYYRIQDIASEVKGILPTLFHYGDVMVQTAGTQPRFVMKQVPHAPEIVLRIHALLEEDQQYHAEKKKTEGMLTP